MRYHMVLVGAGLTSATIAALNTDKKILVVERDEIGGMCRTENEGDIEVHKYGPHIFHTSNHKVWSFVNQYATFNGYVHRAKACVEDNILSFPINLETYNQLYAGSKPFSPDDLSTLIVENDADNFEDYLAEKIGYDLYDKFYKGYSEKMWGMPAKNIPLFIAKRIPIRTSYNDLYFNDLYQGVPKDGYTVMIERMMEHCDIQSLDFLSDKDYYESLADTVIYTGSVDEYFDYELGELPYRSMEYFMSIEPCKDFQGIGQMNYPDDDVPYTRIIEHKHFNWINRPITITTTEYPRPWKRGGHLNRFYPIPLQENMNLYEEYYRMDSKAIFAGRLGDYSYINMDEAIKRAMILDEQLKMGLL